jgi:hypothetical protein
LEERIDGAVPDFLRDGVAAAVGLEDAVKGVGVKDGEGLVAVEDVFQADLATVVGLEEESLALFADIFLIENVAVGVFEAEDFLALAGVGKGFEVDIPCRAGGGVGLWDTEEDVVRGVGVGLPHLKPEGAGEFFYRVIKGDIFQVYNTWPVQVFF